MYDPFCPMCGYENDGDSQVCQKCGSPLEEDESVADEPQDYSSEELPAKDSFEKTAIAPQPADTHETPALSLQKEEQTPREIPSTDDEAPGKTAPDTQTSPGDTTEQPPTDTLLNNRFKKIQVIHRARTSTIYRALDVTTGDIVAIKEMEDRFRSDYDRQVAVKAFQEEAKRLKHLEHRGLPGIIDYFSGNDKYYVVKQFVEGHNLQTRMTERGNKPYDENLIIKWVLQIIDTLTYLHSQRPPIIYKILKPSNILVDNNDETHLVDYDIDRLFIQGSDVEKIYTSSFTAPEVREGFRDSSSDIFSLGMLIRFLYTGIDPDRENRYTRFKRIRDVNHSISAFMDDLVLDMVSPSAQNRPSTVESVRQRILEGQKTGEPSKTTATSSVPLPLQSVSPQKAHIPVAHRSSPGLSDIRVSTPPPEAPQKGKVSREWLGLAIVLFFPVLLIGIFITALAGPAMIASSQVRGGDRLMEKGEHRQALDQYKKAHETRKSATTFLKMAEAHYSLENYQEAINDYLSALQMDGRLKPQLDGKLAMAYMKKGVQEAENNDFLDAGKSFHQAIQFNPRLGEIEDAEVLLLRGKSLFHNNQLDLAMKDYDRVLEIDPENPEAHYGRGQVFISQGKYDKAKEELARAKEIDEEYQVHYIKSMESIFRNRLASATESIRKRDFKTAASQLKAADLMVENISPAMKKDLSAAYGALAAGMGPRIDSAETVRLTNRALELSESNHEAKVIRGQSYMNLGELDKAIEDLSSALPHLMDPRQKEVLTQQIKLLEQRREREKRIRGGTTVPVKPMPTSSPAPTGNARFFVAGKGPNTAVLGREGTKTLYLIKGTGTYNLPEKEWLTGNLEGTKVTLWVTRYNRHQSYEYTIRELETVTVAQISRGTTDSMGRTYNPAHKITFRRPDNRILTVESMTLARKIKQGEQLFAEISIDKITIYDEFNNYQGESLTITGGGGVY